MNFICIKDTSLMQFQTLILNGLCVDLLALGMDNTKVNIIS